MPVETPNFAAMIPFLVGNSFYSLAGDGGIPQGLIQIANYDLGGDGGIPQDFIQIANYALSAEGGIPQGLVQFANYELSAVVQENYLLDQFPLSAQIVMMMVPDSGNIWAFLGGEHFELRTLKVWDGTQFVRKPVKRWTGTEWKVTYWF